MSTEDRLIRLESCQALQDRTVEQLNDVIAAQQRQIDRLERQVEQLARRLRQVADAQAQAAGGSDAPPPHYQVLPEP